VFGSRNNNRQGSHCFLVTMQPKHNPKSPVLPEVIYSAGTITPAEDMTRFDVMNSLVEQLVKRLPFLRDGVVLGFSLERNDLFL
jgi:hypothetical protein